MAKLFHIILIYIALVHILSLNNFTFEDVFYSTFYHNTLGATASEEVYLQYMKIGPCNNGDDFECLKRCRQKGIQLGKCSILESVLNMVNSGQATIVDDTTIEMGSEIAGSDEIFCFCVNEMPTE